MTTKRISRRYSYTGQSITVELRDGTRLTGRLTGWGPSRLSMKADSKNYAFANVQVAAVYAA